MAKLKLTLRRFLKITLLGIGLLSVFSFFTHQKHDSMEETEKSPFSEAKEMLLKEELLNGEDARGCSHSYGIELIRNYHRAGMDICSGLGQSSVFCHVNSQYKGPRMLCIGKNHQVDKLRSESTEQVILDCSLKVYNWISKEVDAFMKILPHLVETDALDCTSYIEHPVFILKRYDSRNIYHVLEDVTTTYESLLVLDLDPKDVEVLIWDEYPTNNTLFQIYSTIFGKGVRILREAPFGAGTCFRQSIFNMNGGNSIFSQMGGVGTYTECSNSPIFKSLRHFFYKSLSVDSEILDPNEAGVKLVGFISRRQFDPSRTIGRVLPNEEQITLYIRKHLPKNWRLVILRPELMTTFKEQVETFKNLDILMGIHGAGLANVMFMKSGTHLVEIFHDDRGDINRHYYNMCKWLGIHYHSAGYFPRDVVPKELWKVLRKVIGEEDKVEQSTKQDNLVT